MIKKFPHLSEKTKQEVMNWLKSEEAEAKAEAFRYKSCHNTDMEQKALYTASAFASIVTHLEYHMEDKQ